jgi:hypothetical protein
MRTNYSIRALLYVFLITILSCSQKSDELPRVVGKSLQAARSSNSTLVTDPKMTVEYGAVTIVWKKAVYFDKFTEVPFELNGQVARPRSQQTGIGQGRQRLLLLRGSEKRVAFVVKYIPSPNYRGDINIVNSRNFNTLKFSGLITLSKVGGKAIRLLEIDNGKIVKTSVFRKSNSQKSANARVQGCGTWCQDTDWYSCSGGECYYTHTNTDCWQECDNGGDGGSGDEGVDCNQDPFCNNNGGGPLVGGGGNGNNYEDYNSDLDCASFVFSQTAPNWQEAGVIGFRINIAYMDGSGRGYQNYDISGQIVIGMPVTRANGDFIPAGAASEIAAQTVDQAADITFRSYRNTQGVPSHRDIENSFRSNLQNVANAHGVNASTNGSGNPQIAIRQSAFKFWGTGNCN